MPEFVHLHVHSEYSLRQGTIRLKDLIQSTVSHGQGAVAITDTHALYGAVPFYQEARAAGVRPILGLQVSVAKEDPATSAGKGRAALAHDVAVLLAEDFEGYQNLVTLTTLLQRRLHTPCVTRSELMQHAGHLIALVGGGESLILRLFGSGHGEQAQEHLRFWQGNWDRDALFIDVQDHGVDEERQGLRDVVSYARHHAIPLVATNDAHYLRPEDADLQRVFSALDGTGQARVLEGARYDLASPQEMARRFAKLPEALRNTLVVAERCQVTLPTNRTLQPIYPTQSGETSIDVLRRAARVGVQQRYGRVQGEVQERLEYELSVIERLGFADYFLVVADFIRYAHKQGISTGPGRGSAAGSLVAYALRITDVDPIRYQLLFERFLNPERVSWPDIDTDFEYERRGEVISYVVERYGQDFVAQIGTFGTLAARAAIRDAGRVLKTDPSLVDRLAKLIPSHPGVTLQSAQQEVDAISKLMALEPAAATLWNIARQLEGLPRHTSTHAAGVVISPVPLSRLVPVQPGPDGTSITQYPMEDLERLGLMKMDFLGLRTLTLIDRCIASVRDKTGQVLDWRCIPEDDPRTYAMLSRGDTTGCFQLESNGVRRMLRDLKPTNLEDIIAVISLYRPGPMENIPTFIAAKHGKAPIHYPHPSLEPILRDTYGVIVYQEQIMMIAAAMAGFSLGQADMLRRAVSKKKREVLDAERDRFVEGCLAKGYGEQVANEVYDLIVRFADYGFNRCHAAAYAVLAYRTAYLRANHLPEFLAALLSMVAGVPEKTKEYLQDAKAHQLQVLFPSVLYSGERYCVEGSNSIRPGLLSVRNVGQAAADAIIQARAQSQFTSLVDFLSRVNSRVCNRKAVESLLSAKAFDELLPDNTTGVVATQILNEAYLEAGVQATVQGVAPLFGYGKAPTQATLESDGAREPANALRQALYIRYASGKKVPDVKAEIRRVLMEHKGETRVALFDEKSRRVRLLDEKWTVSVSPELVAALEEVVGLGNARVGRLPDVTPDPGV